MITAHRRTSFTQENRRPDTHCRQGRPGPARLRGSGSGCTGPPLSVFVLVLGRSEDEYQLIIGLKTVPKQPAPLTSSQFHQLAPWPRALLGRSAQDGRRGASGKLEGPLPQGPRGLLWGWRVQDQGPWLSPEARGRERGPVQPRPGPWGRG